MKIILLAVMLFFGKTEVYSQDVYKNYRKDWLKKTLQYKPELHSVTKTPVRVVKMEKDENAFQQVKATVVGTPRDYYSTSLKSQKGEYILDFGEHLTGFVSFMIKSNVAAHAPVQLRIKFAEVPAEMNANFGNYKGSLSKAWLQEEIITLHTMPDTVSLPNRYAFRFIKIEVLSSAEDMDFFIRNIKCFASTSAGRDLFAETNIKDAQFQTISEVSVKTLAECMQTVFEDGPKRDRRIWIGDLKLQALANYYSFQNNDLVKRGLYLYAKTAAENGLVYGTLFERPAPHPQKHFPIDYCLLYNTVLYDYYEETNDISVPEDLWIVAKYQVLNILPHISKEGVFNPDQGWWYFIDWNDQLDKKAALHGTVIYALNKTWELARILDKQDELPDLPEIIALMKMAAKEKFFDKKSKLFTSGDSKQISTASQVWMILSETVTPAEGKELFYYLKQENPVTLPVSPYLYHYVAEAMIACEMNEEARNLILDYWGGMVKKGADTFWEVYDPGDDFLSPYGSFMMNSYCHAWSCTPVYFLRKYKKQLFNQ